VRVVPGETALAFYKASNPTDTPITGVSTYNVTPFKAGTCRYSCRYRPSSVGKRRCTRTVCTHRHDDPG
jgi:hypothetical protein